MLREEFKKSEKWERFKKSRGFDIDEIDCSNLKSMELMYPFAGLDKVSLKDELFDAFKTVKDYLEVSDVSMDERKKNKGKEEKIFRHLMDRTRGKNTELHDKLFRVQKERDQMSPERGDSYWKWYDNFKLDADLAKIYFYGLLAYSTKEDCDVFQKGAKNMANFLIKELQKGEGKHEEFKDFKINFNFNRIKEKPLFSESPKQFVTEADKPQEQADKPQEQIVTEENNFPTTVEDGHFASQLAAGTESKSAIQVETEADKICKSELPSEKEQGGQ